MSRFLYTAYGLSLISDFPFPELLPGAEPPVVQICIAEVPRVLPGARQSGITYQVSPNIFLRHLESIASYLVRDGNRIQIAAAPEVNEAIIRLLVLGPAFGVLLHQRGLLVLHGSAIQTRNGAVIFGGSSGSGKSTLAGGFWQRNYPLISDDICAIALDAEGAPQVFPAFPQIRLWKDGIERLGKGKNLFQKAEQAMEKYELAIKERFTLRSLPVLAIYMLNPVDAQAVSLSELKGYAKIEALIQNTYGARMLAALHDAGQYFKQAAAAAGCIKIANVYRPRQSFLLEELLDILEDDFSTPRGK